MRLFKLLRTVIATTALGRQVATLLDVETPVPDVKQGNPREDLRTVAILTTVNGSTPDFVINVNCGVTAVQAVRLCPDGAD